TPINIPNELERKLSIIKPVLLPSNSKYNGSSYDVNSLDRSNSRNSITLNTKYPVPLEPINKTPSHSSINNESSYVDNSYLPASPKLHTYRSQGEDILKTRKICVVNTPSNNLMNIIDSHSNNLSINSLNQKVGNNETSSLSNSNSNTDNKTTKNNKKSKNNNKNKNIKSKNNKNGNSKISKTTTYTAKKKKSLHPKQTETGDTTKKLSSSTLLKQENKASEKESPFIQKEEIKTLNISTKNEEPMIVKTPQGNTNINNHSNNNIILNENNNINIINKTKSIDTFDNNGNSNIKNNDKDKNKNNSNITTLKSNSKEKNNKKPDNIDKKNNTSNITENCNSITKKKKAQTTIGKGKTTTKSTITSSTKKDSNKKVNTNGSNTKKPEKLDTSKQVIDVNENKIQNIVQNDMISSTSNKSLINNSEIKESITVENQTIKNDTNENSLQLNNKKQISLTNSISEKKTIQFNVVINDSINITSEPTTSTTTNINITSNNKDNDNKNSNAVKSKDNENSINLNHINTTGKETISTITSPPLKNTNNRTKKLKNTSNVANNIGSEDKLKERKDQSNKKSNIEQSNSNIPSKKKENGNSTDNKKLEEPTSNNNKLPILSNTSSKASTYLKPKASQLNPLNQTSIPPTSSISQQSIRNQNILSTVDFGTNFNDNVKQSIYNHDPKGIYQGTNNLFSDSGGKSHTSGLLDTAKNCQSTINKIKLPTMSENNTHPQKLTSTPAPKTSAISGNVNLNDMFPMPNTKLTPLSSINANNKINYLMEKENQQYQESSSIINNFPQSRPIHTVLKPIQLTGNLPFGNEQTIENIGIKNKYTPLDNIPSKPAVQILQPLKSHNQIKPDFGNQSLNPLPKIPNNKHDLPFPAIRKSKK
ncbi:hypothetical protein BCR36DRAFT_280606, partial [Piromyces finnis]